MQLLLIVCCICKFRLKLVLLPAWSELFVQDLWHVRWASCSGLFFSPSQCPRTEIMIYIYNILYIIIHYILIYIFLICIFMVTLFLKHLKCTPTVTILIFLSTMIQSDFCYFICMYVCFYVHIC